VRRRGISFQAPVNLRREAGHLLLGSSRTTRAPIWRRPWNGVARPDDCRGRARIVAGSFLRLVPRLEERGIDTIDALLEYQDMPAAPLDLSAYAFTADDLKALPAGPGVYRFIDREGRVIYVGKAKNLLRAVGSYFAPPPGAPRRAAPSWSRSTGSRSNRSPRSWRRTCWSRR